MVHENESCRNRYGDHYNQIINILEGKKVTYLDSVGRCELSRKMNYVLSQNPEAEYEAGYVYFIFTVLRGTRLALLVLS